MHNTKTTPTIVAQDFVAGDIKNKPDGYLVSGCSLKELDGRVSVLENNEISNLAGILEDLHGRVKKLEKLVGNAGH